MNKLTLVVAQACTGNVMWTRDLGSIPKGTELLLGNYRPQFVGAFIMYRTATGRWLLTNQLGTKTCAIYSGTKVAVSWSADGQYAAIVDNELPARVHVIENPFLKADECLR